MEVPQMAQMDMQALVNNHNAMVKLINENYALKDYVQRLEQTLQELREDIEDQKVEACLNDRETEEVINSFDAD